MGFYIVRNEKLLLNKDIIKIQEQLEQNKAGFRTQAGTKLVNAQKEVVYTPPQDKDEILNLMANLEKFINDPNFSPLDPLTKMAIIITSLKVSILFTMVMGVLDVLSTFLYLVLQNLLDLPVLLSKSFILYKTKQITTRRYKV